MKRFVAAMAVFVLGSGLGYVAGYSRGSTSVSSEQQLVLEQEFARSMTGVTLGGVFTIDGVDRAPSDERYTIARIEKIAGDMWLFHARLEFGGTDVLLPVPVKLLWAGDTPVLTLTDASLPGLGTYTARLVFYRGRYAGLWSNPETGGFQYGTIESTTE